MGQAGDYEALIRELLVGVAGGWSYSDVTVWLWETDEEDLTLWLRKFAEGLSLEQDRELIEQFKLLGKMTPGKLASQALTIVARLDRSYEQNSELLNHEAWLSTGKDLFEQGMYEEAINSFDRSIEINPELHEAYYIRGIALDNLGNSKEAIASLDRAIEINPDKHKAWSNRGAVLVNLGRYEKAIASFDQATEIKPDFLEAWYNRGNALFNLGRYGEAIASFDRTIEIKPDDHEAWYNRGSALDNLGRYEEAIASYDRAIEIKPEKHKAWSNRGSALDNLGRYEESIASYDRATEIKPDFHEAWYNRGNALRELGNSKEAIASFDQAIEINPDDHSAWSNRGNVLRELGRYEEAIASFDQATEIKPDLHVAWYNRGAILCDQLREYKLALEYFDRAIEIKPDDHPAWYNRGNALKNLGRYAEAIASYDQATEIRPDLHVAWFNRGIAIGLHKQSYRAEIEAYQEAFQQIHSDTHPEGWGFLQHKIGRTHYEEGNNQLLNYRRHRHLYYGQALTSYHNALTTLTRDQFPALRLETLIDTAKAHLAQQQPSAARDCQIEAVDILGDLLNAEPTFAGKKRLQLEHITLSQLDVDLFVASGDNIRALEAAERDKNNHLTWLLTALDEKIISPKYDQMQQLLTTASGDQKIGIVYWHLSPDNLTTFILHPHHPNPQVLTNSSQQLKNWLKDYDTDNLDTAKLAELGNILKISQINPHLDGIEHLILIPHRDLHRLPLHTYWQNLPTTYLPSIQIGLNLQAKPQSDFHPVREASASAERLRQRSAGFLLIESPDYSQPTKLKNITKTFGLLTNPEIESAIIAHLFQPKTIIPTGSVKKKDLCAAFNTPHTYGHFNGHAYHDPRCPQDSSLVIDGDELTCQDLAHIDLTPYYLISLSACETGLTTHQSIETEYVGLVSAFLSRGTNYVVSTLWSVKDLPSSLLMMAFYLYLKDNPAPLALYKAADWLKNLTHAEEAKFHQNVYQRLPQNLPGIATVKSNLQNAEVAAQENPTAKPYSNPYYWAAFTISGWG
jgi:tetratricopeptide (TPR) repeat protein